VQNEGSQDQWLMKMDNFLHSEYKNFAQFCVIFGPLPAPYANFSDHYWNKSDDIFPMWSFTVSGGFRLGQLIRL
jgi:hypothetical protein